jgi:hypothetical protein
MEDLWRLHAIYLAEIEGRSQRRYGADQISGGEIDVGLCGTGIS